MKKFLLISLLAAAALPLATSAAEKVPLETELPKPLFMGTPKPMGKIPNLAPQTAPGERAPLMVPEGVTNLADGKEATSSDEWPIIGEVEYATDGDKQGDEGYYVELGPETQWLQIDLGESAEIHALMVWRYHAEPRVYFDVVVQVSDDPEFKKGVKTIFNNDHDNSSKLGKGEDLAFVETFEGQQIDAGGVKGRYVRLYSNGNTSNPMNHYIEVEVFGLPAK